MDHELPIDPMSALAANAVQLHEIYEAYLEAGFNAAQAMHLTGIILKCSLTGTPGSE